MTYFSVDGKTLTKACNRNKRLMNEAKKIFFSSGIEAATKFVKDNTKNAFRTRKVHNKNESLEQRRKALGVSGALMARTMGYSRSFYLAAEKGECNYSESFYQRFVKSEKKLRKLLTVKK